jgi:transcriptional regulator with XRE-family HTH domain
MNDRLVAFLQAEQLTPAKFADIMNIQRSGVSHLLSGRNKPGYDFFDKFLRKFPTINIEWLISGRGKMYKEVNMPTLFPEIQPVEPASPAGISSIKKDIELSKDNSQEDFGLESVKKDSDMVKKNNNKLIDKVIILYTDGTFSDYLLSK